MKPAPDRIYDTLKRYWGFTEFRPVQLEIIRSVLEGRDTLALMPTGGGKSLTYQVPTLAREGLCIVVTPLIALMKDQVDRLRARAVPAVAIHSGLSPRQIDIALDNCAYGDVKFLYVAPERLATEAFRLRVVRMNVQLIAVDEAHCISQWGYDFRPSYLRIAELREKLPGVPVLALTASATKTVADDIMRHLKFPEPHILRSSFARPNLSYSVRRTDDKNGQLLRLVRNVPGTGIVYVRTREGTEQIADLLRQEGTTAAAYHGGLGHAERSLRQEEWLSGKTRVMVATNAFGMGIDKADVRFVVHYAMCDSLESYYQEAGRAGRDSQRAYALLLVASDDSDRIARRFEQEFPPLEKIKEIYERICSYLQIGIGDGGEASFLFNIHDFCARERLYSGTVTSALKLLQQNGYMTLTDAQENPARVMFCVSRDELYKLRVQRDELDHFIRTLLRLYNGVFTEFRPIDEGELATWSGYTVQRVKELLKRLWQLRVIRYIPSNRSPILFMNEERLPRADLYIAPRDLQAAAGADARTLRTDDRLRRQRAGVPQRRAGAVFRRGKPRAVRGLRHLPGPQTGRESRRPGGRNRSRNRSPRSGRRCARLRKRPARKTPGAPRPVPGRPAPARRRTGLPARTAGRSGARTARGRGGPDLRRRTHRAFQRSRRPGQGKIARRRAAFLKINA